MLNLINWDKPLIVNGVEYPNSAAAYGALSEFDGELTIELNINGKNGNEEKQAEEEVSAEVEYIFVLPKWLARKNECPMVMQGLIEKESSRAYYINAVGLVDAPIQCCICGRELTNEISKKLGIGPVCAEKFGGSFSDPDDLKQKMSAKRFRMWLPKSRVEVEEVSSKAART